MFMDNRNIIEASSNPGDVTWEPFGGTCPAAIASAMTGRSCYSSEMDERYYLAAIKRLKSTTSQQKLI
jgi:site-specific DNA-methyltransferase (adenine-specific)